MNLLAVTQGTDHIDLGFASHLFDDDFPPAFAEDAAATLLVENAGVGRTNLEISLVTVHDIVPPVFAPVLDARVAPLAGEPVRKPQLEVADDQVLIAVFGDEKAVSLGGIFLGGDAGDGAVLDRPMRGSPGPTGKVFAIKNALESRLDLAREGGRQRRDHGRAQPERVDSFC